MSIRENCGFRGFRRQEGRAVAADTEHEGLTADAFVVATGAWTPLLNDQLGCKVPIQPGKGYSLTMPRPSICPTHPLIFPETRVAVTPFQSGYRLGSTMEFSGYDTTIDPTRLQLLHDGVAPYLREPECEPIEETWYGWRPMTWDSLPIIDRSPTLHNVMIAAGHNMLGLSMAPATGKLVAELLGGDDAVPRPQAVPRQPVLKSSMAHHPWLAGEEPGIETSRSIRPATTARRLRPPARLDQRADEPPRIDALLSQRRQLDRRRRAWPGGGRRG